MKKRSILLVIAAWLFLPPLIFSSGFARAQLNAPVTAAPRIERFDLDPPTRLVPGEALIFRLTGSAHGNATVKIDGVKGKVTLKEVMYGIYEGAYTIRPGDQIVAESVVIGTLSLGTRERQTVLAQPLVESPRVAAYPLVPARFSF